MTVTHIIIDDELHAACDPLPWKGKKYFLFVDDCPCGNYILPCSECEGIFDDHQGGPVVQCPICSVTLTYPPGADW